MSYHYDFGQASSNLSWKSLSDLFLGLLIALVHRRESVNESRRPIVFVAYGLGALILKKVMTYQLLCITFTIIKHYPGLIGSKPASRIPTDIR